MLTVIFEFGVFSLSISMTYNSTGKSSATRKRIMSRRMSVPSTWWNNTTWIQLFYEEFHSLDSFVWWLHTLWFIHITVNSLSRELSLIFSVIWGGSNLGGLSLMSFSSTSKASSLSSFAPVFLSKISNLIYGNNFSCHISIHLNYKVCIQVCMKCICCNISTSVNSHGKVLGTPLCPKVYWRWHPQYVNQSQTLRVAAHPRPSH